MIGLPSRVSLANLPTPIYKLERLTKYLGGPEIYIKRDDFTGSEISGNKVRKLEFSAAEALSRGADVLVTCGGIQSNHCRATAVAAARLGLSSTLVLRGDPPSELDGNYLLDILLKANIKYVTPEEYRNNMPQVYERIGQELQAQGLKPYFIPEGASNGIGTFGYAQAVLEITEQEKQLGENFQNIVIAVGSGGTYAGLILGTKLLAQDRKIYGVNVCEDAPYFVNRIYNTLQEAKGYLAEDVTINREDIRILDGYVGPGYGLNMPGHLETIRTVAELEGIILDPVYTAKAMHGLMMEIRKGTFTSQDKVMFIHTGGHFGLFPIKERFV